MLAALDFIREQAAGTELRKPVLSSAINDFDRQACVQRNPEPWATPDLSRSLGQQLTTDVTLSSLD
jgi:hypothetical protein